MDANTRMEKAEAEIAQIHKGLGVPDEAVWRQAGYSPDQVARFKQDARLDRAADVASIAGALRQAQGPAAGQQSQTFGRDFGELSRVAQVEASPARPGAA